MKMDCPIPLMVDFLFSCISSWLRFCRAALIQQGLAAIVVWWPVVTVQAAGDETWSMLSDFDQTARVWSAESGDPRNVRVTDQEAHTGRHSLAIGMWPS